MYHHVMVAGGRTRSPAVRGARNKFAATREGCSFMIQYNNTTLYDKGEAKTGLARGQGPLRGTHDAQGRSRRFDADLTL